MKKFFLHILLVGVLGMLAVSCSDEFDSLGLESNKAQVMFSIAMDSQMARSRAAGETWGNYDPTNEGTPYDNRIDMNQFEIEIEALDANGQSCSLTLDDIVKWQDSKTYQWYFIGEVKENGNPVREDLNLSELKISVFANMGTGETFSLNDKKEIDYIPMWGAQTIENVNLKPGTRYDVSDKTDCPIYLLRAMAKIEVRVSEEMSKAYSLTGATLNRYNKEGYCMPINFETTDNTTDLTLNGSFTPLSSSRNTLPFKQGETDNTYFVYLPEVANDISGAEKLNISVNLVAKDTEGNPSEETVSGKFYLDTDIIRNHWYKYTINNFAGNNVTVNYEEVSWDAHRVDINVGGEGFLGLSTDVLEIFSDNTGTLKFNSSSTIKTIELKDIYKHESNGTFTEVTEFDEDGNPLGDEVSAYYISKFGQKIQLGKEPGFDVVDWENVKSKEEAILAFIAEKDKGIKWSEVKNDNGSFEGTITINSPYINHDKFGDSHYDTPRYLEFLVTNEQGLTATFRMMQYPPVVITNVEGYFSYREDFRLQSMDDYQFDINQFRSPYITEKPGLNSEPTHYKNPEAPFFFLACFFPYHEHEWDPETKRIVHNNGGGCAFYDENGNKKRDYADYDETIGGSYERDHLRVDSYKGSPVTGTFHRTHYYWTIGTDFVNNDYNDESKYYQSVGIPYSREVEVKRVDEETGEVKTEKVVKHFVRHYTGNSFNFFWAKYVETVYPDGKAMLSCADSNESYNNWIKWYEYYKTANHRMYHIKSTISTLSSNYTLGWPEMKDENGRKYTAEGESNSKKVSPSFMVASHLGSTDVPKDRYYSDGRLQYDVPEAPGMYPLAKRQCEQYVEAIYVDENKDGIYTPNVDPITHYSDWRLPTKAELEIIDKYQESSRAMDQVLNKESYFCASQIPGVYNNSTILYNRGRNHPEQIKDYHIRCVRDVKPGEKLHTRKYPI